jgi:hypothetical protein
LPGTRLFNELSQNNRLIFTEFPQDWKYYDMAHLTFKVNKISNEEFTKTQSKYSKKLYSRLSLYKKFLKTWIHCRSIQSAMWAYSSNKNYRNVSLSNR